MGCVGTKQAATGGEHVVEIVSQTNALAKSSNHPTWQRKPTVQYRRFDEGSHFLLGLSVVVIEMILSRMLPWKSYVRDESRFSTAEGRCWNTSEATNGYDLGVVVRDFLRAHNFENLSIAEVLWSEGLEGVGKATVFFSHIQQLPVETALETLRGASKAYSKEMGTTPRFFIDYMCIRQAQKGDFDLTVVRQAIHDIPLLLVELDDAQGEIGTAAPAYFGRSFCIFEVFAAVEESASTGVRKVLVFGPAVKNPSTAPWLAAKVTAYGYNIVRSEDGQCRWPSEKAKIDQFIQSSVGFAEVDRTVGAAVAEGCLYGLQVAAAQDPSHINVAAATCMQAADLTDKQLQQFCTGHLDPLVVREIDLRNCSQIVSLKSLGVFSGLEELELDGCHNIDPASLTALCDVCKNLDVDVGGYLMDHGRYNEAIECYEKNLAIANDSGNREDEGFAHGDLGLAFDHLGQFEKAIEHHKMHLQVMQQLGDVDSEGGALTNIGCAFYSLGRFDDAIEAHQKCLRLAQRVDNLEAKGKAHGNIGNVLTSLGRFQEALEHHQKSLEIVQQIGDKNDEGSAYGNIGMALQSLGRFEEAIEQHEKNVEIAQQAGNIASEGRAYRNIGSAVLSLGQHERALVFFQKDLAIAQQTGDEHGESQACGNIGSALQTLGRFEESIEFLKKLEVVAQENDDVPSQGVASFNLANSYLGLDDEANALACMQRAHSAFQACFGNEHPHTVAAGRKAAELVPAGGGPAAE